MSDLPHVSVVVPTLNCAGVLARCLETVRAQDYPIDRLELVVADGGSRDGTREVARRFGARVVENPLRTGEAGKAAGAKAAGGELLAFVDSDNLLVGRDWLRRMVEPFTDPTVAASEPLAYAHRPEDPRVTRYCALLGMNDPLCLFLGNYDRTSALTGRWTGVPVLATERGSWLHVRFDHDVRLPTIGANGFVARASLVRDGLGDYFFDVDIVERIRRAGLAVAKVKTSIVHLYADGDRAFLRKQYRRVRDYWYHRRRGERAYPWARQSRRGLARFVLATIAVVPLLRQAARGRRRVPDAAWSFHVRACWYTLLAYAWGSAVSLVARGPASRAHWRAGVRGEKPQEA